MDFVALDFETTGIDPKTDRIIQIGAVRMRAEAELERFVTYVHLKGAIPVAIKRLTGIQDTDLQDAPSAKSVIPHLLEFIGSNTVVAHNAAFEKIFLETEAGRLGLRIPTIRFVDTVELARLACPELSAHRLDTLVEEFGIDLCQHHDALSDAKACGVLYSRLRDRLKSLGRQTLEMILSVGDADWPLRDDVLAALDDAPNTPFYPDARGSTSLEALRSTNEPSWLDTPALARLFEPGKQIAAAFEDYEERHEQIQMMALVADSFNDDKHLLAEAGTGTGKSLAYLVPAARWALDNSQHVVISTHTINLQEQLLHKDIPLLVETLGWDLRATLLKGRSNYVCLRRFFEAVNHDLLSFGVAERRVLARFVAWLAKTENGDRSEVAVYGPAESVWDAIMAKIGSCAASRCPYRERCFVSVARKRAAASHIVVANHSLVFSDIAANNKVLPPYSRLILDEAHHLEDVAALNLGVNLTLAELFTLTAEWSATPVFLGRLGRLDLNDDDRQALTEQVQTIGQKAQQTAAALQELGTWLASLLSRAEQQWSGRLSIRLVSADADRIGWAGVHATSDSAIDKMRSLAAELAGFVVMAADDTLPGGVLDLAQQASNASGAISEAVVALESVLGSFDEDTVRWLEASPDRMPGSICLRAAPVDVSELLRDRVFDVFDSVVMTSATLAVEGEFNYIKNRLGLDHIERDRLIEEVIGSPFDFYNQALLCIPTDMPPVQKTPASEMGRRLGSFLQNLVLRIGGRTLVLFTSHRLLQEVYRSIKPVCEQHDISLLAQGIDGNRTRLIEELRRGERTVVFGSNSFWEGVDVPGKSLSCVVMVRLPFWPPSMPIIQARQERFEKSGRSSFIGLSLPEAIIRFKQGFGRLIRAKTDKGAVIVLDQRICAGGSRYGQRFINSLPNPRVISGTSDEILDAAGEWVEVRFDESVIDQR